MTPVGVAQPTPRSHIRRPMTATPAPPPPKTSVDPAAAAFGAPPAPDPSLGHGPSEEFTTKELLVRWAIVAAVVIGILVAPRPPGITVESWRLLAIFLGTIVGSMVRPISSSAMVFLGVTAIALTGTLTPAEALAGYADPIVWLVLCAFLISRGVVKTGLG